MRTLLRPEIVAENVISRALGGLLALRMRKRGIILLPGFNFNHDIRSFMAETI